MLLSVLQVNNKNDQSAEKPYFLDTLH